MTTFVTADQDGTPTMWDADPQRVLRRFCAGPRRDLDWQEWSLYAGNAPYQPVCP